MLASKKRPRPQQLDLAPAAESAPLTKCGEWRGDQGDGAGPPKPRKRLCSPSFLTPTLSRLAGSASGMTMSPSGGHSFFDLDLLESGVAREVVHPNVLAYVAFAQRRPCCRPRCPPPLAHPSPGTLGWFVASMPQTA